MSFTFNGVAQILVYFGLLLLITKPMGLYLIAVFEKKSTWFEPVLRPVERVLYKIAGVDEQREHDWKIYAVAMLIFSVVSTVPLYIFERLQNHLPLNPAGMGPVDPLLAWNTAMSFLTNTNWQNYGGETTMSYLSQMAGLAFHNFTSAAVGIIIAVAVIRGFARRSASNLGNFWVDLVRCCLYILLPICFVYALFLVWQGVPETLGALPTDRRIQGFAQRIAMGPVASQEAIKMLGTNGGGFFNANSSHPFENPTAFSNLIEMLSIFTFGAGLIYMFGKLSGNTSNGWALFSAVSLIFLLGAFMAAWGRSRPATPTWPRSGSTRRRKSGRWPSRAATWRGRRCASASPPRRSLPPSPPMPPAAPSIAGMIALRRSAAWCRWSTSSWGRSSLAASAPVCTACWSLRSSRSSSPD